MAPVKSKKKQKTASEKQNGKPDLTPSETKERAKAAITKLTAKDSKEAKDLVAKLEKALQTKDEDFDSQKWNDDIDTMDVDDEYGEADEDGDVAQAEDAGEGKGKNDGDKDKESETREGKKQDYNDGGEKKENENGKGKNQDQKEDEDKGRHEEKGKDEDKRGNGNDEPKSIIKGEPKDDSPLFVPDGSDFEEDEEEDPEYGRPLYRRHDPKLEDFKTVGWAWGRRALFVNQYGPKNAAIHRLNRCADSAEYEENPPPSEKVSNKNNRHGDEILPSGNLKYTRRHIYAIYGVAWEGYGSQDDLDLIDPQLVGNRWPSTYVMVAWNIDNKIEKTWEPRQSLRARWGKADADNAIFQAACQAEDRYGEVQSGQRRATSRSPSVGLVVDTVRQQREKSLGARRSSLSRSRSSTPAQSSPSRAKSSTPARSSPSRSKSSTPFPKVRFSNSNNRDDGDALAEMLEEFRLDYLQCAGVDTFRDLEPKDKKDFVTAWQLRKSELSDDA